MVIFGRFFGEAVVVWQNDLPPKNGGVNLAIWGKSPYEAARAGEVGGSAHAQTPIGVWAGKRG